MEQRYETFPDKVSHYKEITCRSTKDFHVGGRTDASKLTTKTGHLSETAFISLSSLSKYIRNKQEELWEEISFSGFPLDSMQNSGQ